MGRPASCPNPRYSRVLASTFVGPIAIIVSAVAGGLAGRAIAAATAPPEPETPAAPATPKAIPVTAPGTTAGAVLGALTSSRKRVLIGTVIGAGVGAVGGFVPALYAQRATIRSAGCENPGLGDLALYDVAAVGVVGAVGAAARQLGADPKTVGGLGSLASLFAMPLLGRAILRT